MVADLCPYCGNPAHSMGGDFECPSRSDSEIAAAGATPSAEIQVPGSSRSSEDFLRAVNAPPEGTTSLSTGTMVGEYVIQERVGEGGMGTVYSAIQPLIGKKVAIKVLSGKLAKNKNAIQRFILEARAVNDIQHPGLVDIFSFGRLTDGRHYYVMEFLEGGNLGDVLRDRGYLPMAEAIPLFIEVARALVAVHTKGIVHRDLKPENIILLKQKPGTTRQRIKLVDFGLAKLMEGVPMPTGVTGPRTAAGVNVGTPHYMSPEQCRGAKVDARSDLYAFGVLLYEVLTGHLPISGSNPVDIWQAHVERVPPPAHELAPDRVSPEMGAIIAKLLAKRPDQRYQNAVELCEALVTLPEAGMPTGTPLPQYLPTDPTELEELARALDLGQERSELVSLDKAREVLPPAAANPVANREKLDELATTTKDLKAIDLSEEMISDHELDSLRSVLGVKIDTPIRDEGSVEGAQMSVLQINLDSPSKSNVIEAAHAEPGTVVSRNIPKLPSRPVEERQYVPPLAAPVGHKPMEKKNTIAAPTEGPSLAMKLVRGCVIALLLVAATIIAFKAVK